MKEAKANSSLKKLLPLDLQKFLPKYSENQKWAAPLIRLLRSHLPPGGKAMKEADNFCLVFAIAKTRQGEALTWGSLDVGKAMKEAEKKPAGYFPRRLNF